MSGGEDPARDSDRAIRDDGEEIYDTIDDIVGGYSAISLAEATEALRVHDQRAVTTTLALMQLEALGKLSSQLSHLLQGLSQLKRR